MKIIYSDKILDRLSWFMKIGGITLYPYIILREKYNTPYYIKENERIINHESIHIQQQKQMLIIFFYMWYLFEWIIRLFMKGNAYRNISFEKEAYENESNLEYLKTRKLYSFLKYIF